MATLGDIPSDLARWYARRLKYLWTTSVNEGLGFFIAYTILIFAAALQTQSSLSLRTEDEARLDEFLHSDHQVRDEDRYVSALSVVLSALRSNQRIRQGTCPPFSDECTRARNVVNATVQIAQLIASRASLDAKSDLQVSDPGKGDKPDSREWDVTAILTSNQLPAAAAGAASVAVDRGVNYLNRYRRASRPPPPSAPKGNIHSRPARDVTHASIPSEGPTTPDRLPHAPPDYSGIQLVNCEYGPAGTADEENRRRLEFGLFEAICLRTGSDVSGLQIPEEVAGLQDLTPDVHAQLAARLNNAIGISFALEAALRASAIQPLERHETCPCCSDEQSRGSCAEKLETRTFTAAYFISVDSVLRYWREETIDPVKSLPKNIRWAGREYFGTYERGATAISEEYVSQPYIDIAGAGIVETICRPVTTLSGAAQGGAAAADNHGTTIRDKRGPVAADKNSAEDNKRPPAEESRIAGIVCADLALRPVAVRSLVSYIQGGPLVEAGLMRIQSNGETDIETTDASANSADLNELKDSPQWSNIFSSGWISKQSSRAPTRLIVNSKIWYVVPAARSGTGLFAVALHPSPSSGVGRLFRWAWLGGTCGAALVMLTFTAHQSQRVAVAARDLARLRGLATAVIEVRPDPSRPEDYARQTIVAGNDRAEEVLQIPLPNFGLADGAKPVLGDIFDENRLVAAKPDGTPEWQLITPKEIDKTRRRGETSTYFALLRTPRIVWQLPGKGETAQESKYRWIRVSAGPVILPRYRAFSLNPRGRLESTVGIMVPIIDRKLSDDLDGIVAGLAAYKS